MPKPASDKPDRKAQLDAAYTAALKHLAGYQPGSPPPPHLSLSVLLAELAGAEVVAEDNGEGA